MSLTMLSVVIVLSAVGSVSSSAMVADDCWMLAGQLPANAQGDADCETPNEVARQFEFHRASSAPCCGRYGDSNSHRHAAVPAGGGRAVLAARPLPVAADLPLPAPRPAAIWPGARFSTPSASVATARSLNPSGRPQLSWPARRREQRTWASKCDIGWSSATRATASPSR